MSILHDDEFSATIDFLNQKDTAAIGSITLDFKKTPIMGPKIEEIKQKLETSEDTVIATICTVPVPISDKDGEEEFTLEHYVESYCLCKEID